MYLEGSDPMKCRHARAFLAEPELFVLEDLSASGFDQRFDYGDDPVERVGHVLDWLARFHRQHLSEPPLGLWEHGT